MGWEGHALFFGAGNEGIDDPQSLASLAEHRAR
jgi:hypothetical protein